MVDQGAASPEVIAIIDQRVANADASPEGFVELDDFERATFAVRLSIDAQRDLEEAAGYLDSVAPQQAGRRLGEMTGPGRPAGMLAQRGLRAGLDLGVLPSVP